jgi:DNA-binding MarR family transcriptional regulator
MRLIMLEDLLGVKDYALSRLLAKLEKAHYITRRRKGNDKKNKLADIIGSGTISLDDWREARARLLSAETRTSEKLTGRS